MMTPDEDARYSALSQELLRSTDLDRSQAIIKQLDQLRDRDTKREDEYWDEWEKMEARLGRRPTPAEEAALRVSQRI